jgi:outer membrane protein assembly factor BamB
MNSTNQAQVGSANGGNKSNPSDKSKIISIGMLVLAVLTLMFAAYQIVEKSKLNEVVVTTELQLSTSREEGAKSRQDVADLQAKIGVLESVIKKNNELLDRKNQLTLQFEKDMGKLEADAAALQMNIDSLIVSQNQLREQLGAIEDEKLKRGTVVWEVPVNGAVSASPALFSDSLFFGTDTGSFYAIQAKTGATKWRFQSNAAMRSSPCITADQQVIFGASDNVLYSFSANSGERLWVFETGAPITAAPIVIDDTTVGVGSWDKVFYFIDTQTGMMRASIKLDGLIRAGAVRIDNTVFIGTDTGGVFAVNCQNASKTWELHLEGGVLTMPSVGTGGLLLVGTNQKLLYAIEQTGQIKWQQRLDSPIIASPLTTVNRIVVSCTEGGLVFANNLVTGTRVWVTKTDGRIRGTPVIGANDVVYLASDNKLWAIDLDEGREVWTHTCSSYIDCALLLDNDGVLYAGTGDGIVLAVYTTSGGLAASSWSIFGGAVTHPGNSRVNAP